MADVRAYNYKTEWIKQIDALLAQDIKSEDIEDAFHDILVEQKRQYREESLRKEMNKKMSALIEQYMMNQYGDTAKRNYGQKDYDTLATGLLSHIDKSMTELKELESLGYYKDDSWSDVGLAPGGTIREDGVVVRRRGPRPADKPNPESVIADFVKNL